MLQIEMVWGKFKPKPAGQSRADQGRLRDGGGALYAQVNHGRLIGSSLCA